MLRHGAFLFDQSALIGWLADPFKAEGCCAWSIGGLAWNGSGVVCLINALWITMCKLCITSSGFQQAPPATKSNIVFYTKTSYTVSSSKIY